MDDVTHFIVIDVNFAPELDFTFLQRDEEVDNKLLVVNHGFSYDAFVYEEFGNSSTVYPRVKQQTLIF